MILSNGDQLGVVETEQAIRRAKDEGLDLIEIAPNASPPVCKIMDFGKYKYEKAKKEKLAKKKQHVIKLKEIKLRPKTEAHDYDFKLKHAREFLDKGDRVKITIVFRGREMAHTEFGHELKQRIINDLADISTVETNGKMEGKRMITILIPSTNKKNTQKQNAEPEKAVSEEENKKTENEVSKNAENEK